MDHNEGALGMTSVTGTGMVEFRFYRPGASAASVKGDFREAGELEMRRDEAGWWTATAQLPAGEYRFRYLADGQWFTDFASHGVEYEKQVWRSVLVVPELIQQILKESGARVAA
jgi:1,4-alpha-glucan branching enzyme